MKERMRQNATQMPLRQNQTPVSPPKQMYQPPQVSPPTMINEQNYTNAKAPVNFSKTFDPNEFTPGGPPNLLIPNKDPRPIVNQNQTVKDVLNRLHNRKIFFGMVLWCK